MTEYSIIDSQSSHFELDIEQLRTLLRNQLNEELELFSMPSLLNHLHTSDATIDRLIAHWQQADSIRTWLALDENKIYLGFVCAQLKPDLFNDKDVVTGEVVAVYVSETYRKLGIASRLFKSAENWMQTQNAHALNVSWLKGNQASESLYKKFGVEEIMRSGRKLL
ncbi:MAG: GNAT family N-acetyltransferase [Agarilytica sp.]